MATRANLIIDQGSDFSTIISLTDDNDEPLDLSTYTGSAYIRKHFSSLTHYSFSSVNCYANGAVELTMLAANSINIPPGRYMYDCEIVSAGNTTTRIVEGLLTITPQVTRPDS